jgi:hypothetical protein
VNIAEDPGIGVGLAEQKVQRTAGIDEGSLQTSHADDLDLNVRAVGVGVVELLVFVKELSGGRARVRDDRKVASGLARNPALFQPPSSAGLDASGCLVCLTMYAPSRSSLTTAYPETASAM